MKKEINPLAAGAVVVFIVAVVGLFAWSRTSQPTPSPTEGSTQPNSGSKIPGVP